MRPLMHVRHHEDHKFLVQQMQSMFAVLASLTLAGLILVAMVMTLGR